MSRTWRFVRWSRPGKITTQSAPAPDTAELASAHSGDGGTDDQDQRVALDEARRLMTRPMDGPPLTYDDARTAADWLAALADISAVASYKALSYDLLDLQPGETLADVGCGVGDDARALAGRVAPEGKVIGLDASAEMIARAAAAANNPPGLNFLVADAAALPLADASCDAARADRMLQHVEDPLRVLREVRRVLKPGGRLVVAEPDWKTMAVYPGGAAPGDDDHVTQAIFDWQVAQVRRPLIGRRLRALLAEAGFTRVAVNPVAYSTTRFMEADLVLELTHAAEGAARDWPERLTPQDARAWRATAEAEDAAGRFFASAPLYFGYAVAGD